MVGGREDSVTIVGDEDTTCDWVVAFCVLMICEVRVDGDDDVVAGIADITGWFKA